MNTKLREQALRLLAACDADVKVAERKRNGRADAVALVMARYGVEATALLRRILADEDAFNSLFKRATAVSEDDHD